MNSEEEKKQALLYRWFSPTCLKLLLCLVLTFPAIIKGQRLGRWEMSTVDWHCSVQGWNLSHPKPCIFISNFKDNKEKQSF